MGSLMTQQGGTTDALITITGLGPQDWLYAGLN